MENQYILRSLEEKIEKWIGKRMVLIIYGARQVGKTMMVNKIMQKRKQESVYFDCGSPEVRRVLEEHNPVSMKNYFGNKKIIILDEAQQVADIGLSLKLFYDKYEDCQVIATGSSSFDLANKIGEPLTGRNLSFKLYSFSMAELEFIYNRFELQEQLETFLIYGTYPKVVLSSISDRILLLKNLADNYLYKDVLAFENLKKPDLLLDLLRLLALQIGSEVSMHELAAKLKTSEKTIERYLDLLEKSFVVFRLRSFSRNLRNEIGKKSKVFFYDLGIRNALIERFVNFKLRDDIGALWENFCVIERIKANQRNDKMCNVYFWRNHSGGEVDYLEESNGKIEAFEFKWSKENYASPQEFLKAYKASSVKIINNKNWINFLLD